MHLEDGRIVIDREDKIAKIVDKVDHVSFSGKRAIAQGQQATYVTERCVIKLTAQGLVVTEIAPGIDLQRDVLTLAATPLGVAHDLNQMDSGLLQPQPIGLTLAPSHG